MSAAGLLLCPNCGCGCSGTCGGIICPCTVDDTGASLHVATCAVCPVPDHYYTHLGIRWRPTDIRCVNLYVPEGGYESAASVPLEANSNTVDDLTLEEFTDEYLADLAGYYPGAFQPDVTSVAPGDLPVAPSGPYAFVADDSLLGASKIRNSHPFAHASNAGNMTGNVTTVCAPGNFNAIEDDVTGFEATNVWFHSFHAWPIGFTPTDALTNNGRLAFTSPSQPIEWPGIASTAIGGTPFRVFTHPLTIPDLPPFIPLVPNVSYERATLSWWSETQIGITEPEGEEEPCICVRFRIFYHGTFVLGQSPLDAGKYRIMRIKGIVFEHESKMPNHRFCNELPICLLTRRLSGGTIDNPPFIEGYTGGNVCLAPYKFKAKMCRAVQDGTPTLVGAPWSGGNVYTGTNQYANSSWAVNAGSYSGPHTIVSIASMLTSSYPGWPFFTTTFCGDVYGGDDLAHSDWPPGSTVTSTGNMYTTFGLPGGTHDGSYFHYITFNDGSPANNTVARVDGSGVTIISGPLSIDLSDFAKPESSIDHFQWYATFTEKTADTVTGGADPEEEPRYLLAGESEFPDGEVFEPHVNCNGCSTCITLWNTGEEYTGDEDEELDDHWEKETSNGSGVFAPASVIDTDPAWIMPSGGDIDSTWIGINRQPPSGEPWGGVRLFRTYVTIAGTVPPSNITGKFAADNRVLSISVNGTVVATPIGSFLGFTDFELPIEELVVGSNEVLFEVEDDGDVAGLLVEWYK